MAEQAPSWTVRMDGEDDTPKEHRKPARIVAKTFVEVLRNKYCTEHDTSGTGYVIVFHGKPKAEGDAELGYLRNICVNRSHIHTFGLEGQSINSLCPNLVDLDLSENLLDCWSELLTVLSQLENLTFLNLARNSIHKNKEVLHDWKGRSLSVENLVLNSTHVAWAEVLALAQILPKLRDLHVCGNEYRKFPNTCYASLNQVETLRLNDNRIESWEEIWKLRHLPNLKHLILSGNPLADVFYHDSPSESSNHGNDLENAGNFKSVHEGQSQVKGKTEDVQNQEQSKDETTENEAMDIDQDSEKKIETEAKVGVKETTVKHLGEEKRDEDEAISTGDGLEQTLGEADMEQAGCDTEIESNTNKDSMIDDVNKKQGHSDTEIANGNKNQDNSGTDNASAIQATKTEETLDPSDPHKRHAHCDDRMHHEDEQLQATVAETKDVNESKTGLDKSSGTMSVQTELSQPQDTGNASSQLDIKGMEGDGKPFVALVSLCLTSTCLSKWKHLKALTAFPALKSVRMKEIKLAVSQTSEDRRKLFVACLPNIVQLNGSEVTDTERDKAERHFLRHFCEKRQKPGIYTALEKKHGKLAPLVDIDIGKGYQEFVTLTFIHNSEVKFTQEVSVKDKVAHLKALIASKMNLKLGEAAILTFLVRGSGPSDATVADCDELHDYTMLSREHLNDGDAIHYDVIDRNNDCDLCRRMLKAISTFDDQSMGWSACKHK